MHQQQILDRWSFSQVTFTAAETGNAYSSERPKTRVRSCERSLSSMVKQQEVSAEVITLQFNNQNGKPGVDQSLFPTAMRSDLFLRCC